MANLGICSKWYRSNISAEFEEFVSLLRKGDVVQVKDTGSDCGSWGICVTDGAKPTAAFRFSDLALTKKCGLVGLDISGKDSMVRINNSRDKLTAPNSISEIFIALEAAARRFSTGARNGSWLSTWMPNHLLGIAPSRPHQPLPWNGSRDFVAMVRYTTDSADSMRDRMDGDGCSEWFDEAGVETFLWLLRVGDLVEFNREKERSLWAVCREHPWRESPRTMVYRCGSQPTEGPVSPVLYSSFRELMKGCRFRINNSYDFKYEAVRCVGGVSAHPPCSHRYTLGRYDPRSNNSWHYAVRLRYRMNKRGNLTLRTQWYSSAEELRPLLAVGDVVRVRRLDKNGQRRQDWAVFVGDVHHRNVLEVAHRCSSGEAVTSLMDSLVDKGACIDDGWGRWIQPKDADVVAGVMSQNDGLVEPSKNMEDPCKNQEVLCENVKESCKNQEKSCENQRLCKNVEVSCKKTEEHSKNMTELYKNMAEPGKNQVEHCKNKEVPSKNIEEPCKSQESSKDIEEPSTSMAEPSKDKESCENQEPLKKMEKFCKNLEESSKNVEEPSKDMAEPRKNQEEHCTHMKESCENQESCKSKEYPSFGNGHGPSAPEVVDRCITSESPRKAIARITPMTEFLKDSECCIDNRWDDGYRPRKAEDVLQDALRTEGLQDPCQCDRFGGTCPHLALGLRYGSAARTALQGAFSCWWATEDLEAALSEALREGDILEARDRMVSHFAVYIGSGLVVHRCDRGYGRILDMALLRQSSPAADWQPHVVALAEFVGSGHFRVNNFWDGKIGPRKAEDVVRQAADSARPINHFRMYELTGNRCFDSVAQTRYELALTAEEVAHDGSCCG